MTEHKHILQRISKIYSIYHADLNEINIPEYFDFYIFNKVRHIINILNAIFYSKLYLHNITHISKFPQNKYGLRRIVDNNAEAFQNISSQKLFSIYKIPNVITIFNIAEMDAETYLEIIKGNDEDTQLKQLNITANKINLYASALFQTICLEYINVCKKIKLTNIDE